MTGSFCVRAAAVASKLARPRVGAVVALAFVMTACSTDDVWRPTVDVGQQTSAITGMQARPLPEQPIRRVASPSAGSASLAGQSSPGASLAQKEEDGSAAEPGPDDEMVGGTAADPYEEAAPVQSVAPERSGQIAAPTEQVAAASSADVYQDPTLDLDMRQAVEETPPVQQEEEPVRIAALPRAVAPLPPSEPYEGSYPRLQSPMPERPTVLSDDEADCRRQLKKLGVKYQDLSPIRDGAACFIDYPVKVSAMGSVQMKPAATLTCRMALTFAQWTKKELQPAARWRYFSGVKTIRQGSSYSCRKIAGSKTQSAHSQGNALDVMAIELNNGKEIDVRKKSLFSFRERKLLNNVRADGCEYFTTVLGPGYNYDHRNHFHFDLMHRKSGRTACH